MSLRELTKWSDKVANLFNHRTMWSEEAQCLAHELMITIWEAADYTETTTFPEQLRAVYTNVQALRELWQTVSLLNWDEDTVKLLSGQYDRERGIYRW